jgi:hypothetical protein
MRLVPLQLGAYLTGGLDDWLGGDVDGDGQRLPAWPSDPPLCRVCPVLSPEGAYDVWLIPEVGMYSCRIQLTHSA